MTSAHPKHQNPQLHVAFDTNTVRNLGLKYLLPKTIYDLVSAKYKDLDAYWYIPRTVRHEREYQITVSATTLIAQVSNAERILGFKLDISGDKIRKSVREFVDTQISELGLIELEIDFAKVNWERLVEDACFRRPPFSAGDSEKGFRDAMVVEGFFQLLNSIDCATSRVILLSADKLVRDAVEARLEDRHGVYLFADIEDVRNLINVISSEVTEELVAEFREKATLLFFEPKEESTLFYKLKIRDRIEDQFGPILSKVPKGAEVRSGDSWTIYAPTFITKKGNRLHWRTRIEVKFTGYVDASSEEESGTFSRLLSGQSAITNASLITPSNLPLITNPSSLFDLSSGTPSIYLSGNTPGLFVSGVRPTSTVTITGAFGRRKVGDGRDLFDVDWSVNISTATQKN